MYEMPNADLDCFSRELLRLLHYHLISQNRTDGAETNERSPPANEFQQTLSCQLTQWSQTIIPLYIRHYTVIPFSCLLDSTDSSLIALEIANPLVKRFTQFMSKHFEIF